MVKILKKIYDKSPLWFALSWIIAYCVLMSLSDVLSAQIGIEKCITLASGLLLTLITGAYALYLALTLRGKTNN